MVAQVFQQQVPLPPPPPPKRKHKWMFSFGEICTFCTIVILTIAGTTYIGTVELISYLVLKCTEGNTCYDS